MLTVCDSPTGGFFDPAPGHDHLKLPSVFKVRPGEWAPVSLSVGFPEVLQLRAQVLRAAALGFEPDVLLVDHMPHGSMGELVPTLEALRASPVRTVLGLRDILDAPETIRRRWHLEGALEAVEEHYDDVLVYGSREVFDVGAAYDWPAHLRDRLHYCGYVAGPGPRGGRPAARRQHLAGQPAGTRLVAAMAGGGADAFPLFDTLLRALPAVGARRRCALVLVTGPFLPPEQQARLRARARGLPVRVLTTAEDPVALMAAADLVVTMAGYNTTAELLRTGTPALLVPRHGPSAEQRMRAGRMAAHGWVHTLAPEELAPAPLAAAILGLLDAPAPAVTTPPDLDGLTRAADHLTGHLTGHLTPQERGSARAGVLTALEAGW